MLLVSGGNGNLARSVIANLLRITEPGNILTTTRDPESAQAQELAARGVTVRYGDFDAPETLGQTIAHEGGHFLGLFHTTEAKGTSHDPLPDTPECDAGRDSNWDGYVSASECQGRGAENFMFWLSSDTARQTSQEQGRVIRRNPATH